jgi:hypothetical protein
MVTTMAAAFKEWALICEALGSGRQNLIIRKGGIAEGREGFAFQNREFFLFPTWFHEQLIRTKLPPETPVPEPLDEEFEIQFAATVEWTRLVTDFNVVRRLAPWHVWNDDVIEERFCYDEPRGVHVACVRIFRLDPPSRLKQEKKYGGCRSWVEIPDLSGHALVSVISDEEHLRRMAELRAVLDT